MNPEPLKNKVWETRAMYKKNNQYSGEEIFTKEDVKSACEFYLRYKDRAKKFITDFPEYAENIVLIVDVYTDGKRMVDYNEWLFKLAFKDVFEGDEQ